MSIAFEYPLLLVLAILLPVLIVTFFLLAHRRRRARLERLGSSPVVRRLLPPAAFDTPFLRATLLGLAALFAGVALAGPRWGTEMTQVRGEGVDMVIVLDASLSMMATDESPSRLERMKQEVRRLRATSSGDRIGIIAFAGRSYILSPLTIDDGALGLFVDNLDPSVVGQAGSAVSRAIRQGTDLLLAAETTSDRALVVMSDWEMFEPEDEVMESAARAAENGISIITVGFGTPDGGNIPVQRNGATVPHRDQDGEIVVTKYFPDVARATAEAGQGTFIDASDTDKAARIRRALAGLRTQQRAMQAGREQSHRFQLFLIPALLLLFAETLLAERRGRRRRAPAAAETAVGNTDDRNNATEPPSPPAAAPPKARASSKRATTAAVMLMLSFAIPATAHADDARDAAAHFRAGRFAQSVEAYRRAVAARPDNAELVYNLGTALLAADSLASAAEVLERLGTVRDPEIRYRALFNLGLSHLRAGLAAEGEEADRSLDAALAAYKSVLLLRSADLDAKWNYELALREKQGGGGGGGGGGGEEPQPSGGADQGQGQPQPQPGSLGQQQAEQILNNAARDEAAVQQRQQQRTSPARPPTGPDW
jgi:Ca-activated chloride channel homolog